MTWAITAAYSEQEINEMNILRALLLAMKRAVEALETQPDFVNGWKQVAELAVLE